LGPAFEEKYFLQIYFLFHLQEHFVFPFGEKRNNFDFQNKIFYHETSMIR